MKGMTHTQVTQIESKNGNYIITPLRIVSSSKLEDLKIKIKFTISMIIKIK